MSGSGVGQAGEMSGGTGGGSSSGCNAETAGAKATHSMAVTVKSDDCVRLVVNPTWSSVNVTIEAQPGTSGYPIAYSNSICGGKTGTGSLSADYQKQMILEGKNPGCDIYVQFEGTGGTLKLMYYD